MKRPGVFVVVLFALALSPLGAAVSTNAVASAAAPASAANAPSAKPPRAQCEAVTKSGARCKRNALAGGKLCRQHRKIERRKAAAPCADREGGN